MSKRTQFNNNEHFTFLDPKQLERLGRQYNGVGR